jgi:hypothetical protein
VRVLRRGVRRTLAELIGTRVALALAAAGTLSLLAASPAPTTSSPPMPVANRLTQRQMDALAPKKALHTAFLVQTNKYGQVTGVKPVQQCDVRLFNVQTYGNALQAFIRTSDGKAEPGTYKLSYSYDPKTKVVQRDVALVSLGGVDPNKRGAALVMMDLARKEAAAAAARAKHAAPVPHGATPTPRPDSSP